MYAACARYVPNIGAQYIIYAMYSESTHTKQMRKGQIITHIKGVGLRVRNQLAVLVTKHITDHISHTLCEWICKFAANIRAFERCASDSMCHFFRSPGRGERVQILMTLHGIWIWDRFAGLLSVDVVVFIVSVNFGFGTFIIPEQDNLENVNYMIVSYWFCEQMSIILRNRWIVFQAPSIFEKIFLEIFGNSCIHFWKTPQNPFFHDFGEYFWSLR